MPKSTDSIVKTGGVANQDAETEDVTRDTYGYSQPQPIDQNREQRISEADRSAAALGVPGVAIPESPATEQPAPAAAPQRAGVRGGGAAPEESRDEEFRRAEIAGDRTASRRDAEKLRTR